MRFVDQEVITNGYKNVGFIARDGYTLQKVFEIIKDSEATSTYIYAPRFVGLATRADLSDFDGNMLNSLLKYYKNITKIDMKKWYSDEEAREILKNNDDAMSSARKLVQ